MPECLRLVSYCTIHGLVSSWFLATHSHSLACPSVLLFPLTPPRRRSLPTRSLPPPTKSIITASVTAHSHSRLHVRMLFRHRLRVVSGDNDRSNTKNGPC